MTPKLFKSAITGRTVSIPIRKVKRRVRGVVHFVGEGTDKIPAGDRIPRYVTHPTNQSPIYDSPIMQGTSRKRLLDLEKKLGKNHPKIVKLRKKFSF